MRKSNLLFAALLFTVTAAGCTDAQAKLKDSSTVLISVGKKTITKGDLYSNMNSSAGASTAINEATKIICDKEIEITDDMRESAEKTLKSYKSMYGDTFKTMLEEQGISEEEYLENNLIASLQAQKLPEKYIEENWDSVVKMYSPVKATILKFESDDDAKAALSELKDGSAAPAEAAANHNSSSSGESNVYTIESTDLDSIVRTVLTSSTPDDGWTEVPSTEGASYYVIKIDDNDAKNFKDEAVTALTSISQISSDTNTFFFKKYGFHVYDKSIYDTLNADYPDYLVQVLKDTKTEDASKDVSSN